VFEGNCAIVGFLNAPGFAKIEGSKTYVDITGFDSISLKVKSSTPSYQGFKMAFTAPGVPKTSIFGGGSYKADFTLNGGDWQVVKIPLTQFSYDWSGYTGRCDTLDPPNFGQAGQQHYCCSDSGSEPSKPEVCVDSKYLSTMNQISVWAEGVEGAFNIEIEYIGASSSSGEPTIVELAETVDSLSTLVGALVAGDLVDTLSSPGPFTVFAPVNAAFGKLPEATISALMQPENKDKLVDILSYHVLSGQILSKDLEASQRVATVEGTEVTVVSLGERGVRVNGAHVTSADVLASNGVVHIIDKVLIPQTDSPYCQYHPGCKAVGIDPLDGLCCPVADGTRLSCCDWDITDMV